MADELLFGGAAGGGKTDLLIGCASTAHFRSIIFRRESKQTKGVEERLFELLLDTVPPHGKYNKTDHEYWSHERGGYKIELGGVKDPGDEKKWHGRPHDLKGFDELTDFTRFQYSYLNIWKRTVKKGQRTRTIACTNPPTDEDGMWVVDYWAPWVDKNYLGKRALPGELRYFIVDEQGRDIEVEAADRVTFGGKSYEPKSRTFIPSLVTDNPFYEGGSYESQLAQLPKELRAKFLGGDFMAGISSDPMQLIPREWFEAAQARWKNRPRPQGPVDQIGVDVSRGGSDEMYVTPRVKMYVLEQQKIANVNTRSGITAAVKVSEFMQDRSTTAGVDLVGVGTSCYDHLTVLRPGRVMALNGANSAPQRDKSGLLGFINARAKWHWDMRELLDPSNGHDICIPPDPELLKEACAIKWKLTPRGIQIESKDEVKVRLKRSPDRWDSLVYSFAQPTVGGAGLLGLYAEESRAMHEKIEAHTKDGVLRIGSK